MLTKPNITIFDISCLFSCDFEMLMCVFSPWKTLLQQMKAVKMLKGSHEWSLMHLLHSSSFWLVRASCTYKQMFCRTKDYLISNTRICSFIFYSNLLCPAGVMLRPGMFSLKVYRAEDIPQSKIFFKFIYL